MAENPHQSVPCCSMTCCHDRSNAAQTVSRYDVAARRAPATAVDEDAPPADPAAGSIALSADLTVLTQRLLTRRLVLSSDMSSSSRPPGSPSRQSTCTREIELCVHQSLAVPSLQFTLFADRLRLLRRRMLLLCGTWVVMHCFIGWARERALARKSFPFFYFCQLFFNITSGPASCLEETRARASAVPEI